MGGSRPCRSAVSLDRMAPRPPNSSRVFAQVKGLTVVGVVVAGPVWVYQTDRRTQDRLFGGQFELAGASQWTTLGPEVVGVHLGTSDAWFGVGQNPLRQRDFRHQRTQLPAPPSP